MRRWNWLTWSAAGLALVLALASPSAATVVAIETSAPLEDHAEQSIQAALVAAVEAAITQALAIGLPWVRMHHARVLEDAVTVQILATDTNPETRTRAPGDEGETDNAPGTRAEPPSLGELQL